ncbi:MAG TPA: DoxX family protein, partial [Chryseolinea sp.]|nr:DoxX family protein [Chryseolinea sp.]
MSLDKITKLGRYFLAIPMVVFGIQHFLYAEFIVHLVPTWVPGRLFWTYFAGVALFASGFG